MVQGTAWLTFANFMSRLLGAFYVIPWYRWMGEAAPQANALFGMGYNVYAIFLLLSTTGLNTAVAKQIAKYNSLNREEEGLALARQFIWLMLGSGLIFAVVMYLGAPAFSALSGAGAELTRVLRSMTLAVFFFPVMSVLRGVFQGYNNAKPNALSQLAEQLIRVIWMLLTAYYIMQLGNKDYVVAVAQSTFAAFIGMLASLAVLAYYFWKEGLLTKLLAKPSQVADSAASRAILIETFQAALPIILTASAIQLYQLIDQVSFINLMGLWTKESKETLNVVYAYLSANPNKIIMIIVAVAVSIGEVGLPLLTESKVKEDRRSVARLIINSFQMLLVFIFPALMGAILLAEPLYSFFYGPSEPLAIGLFIAILIQTFLQCGYMALSPMLHAVFESGAAVRYFCYGFLVKLLTQLPGIWLLGAYGTVLSTGLGLLVPLILMYKHLHRKTAFNHQLLIKNVLTITQNTLIMALPVALVKFLLDQVLQSTDALSSIFYLLVSGLLGGMIYGYLSLKTRSLDSLLGNRAEQLRKIFRIV